MKKQECITSARAGIVGEVDLQLLERKLDLWLDAAASFLRLRDGEELPPATMGQVIENAIASYNARGDEGLTGSASGGQSYSYEDLLEKLKRVAVLDRKPRF